MKQIYVIKNLANSKVYVGQSDSAYDRFRRHRNNKVSHDKTNLEIVMAMKEIGAENFYYEILENCDDSVADEREKYYIQKFNSFKNGYNRTIGGHGYTSIAKEDLEECCKLYEQGKTNIEIESITGISHKTFAKELMRIYPNYKETTQRNVTKARFIAKSKPVIQLSLDGKPLRRFANSREANDFLGKSPGASAISRCCRHIKSYETAYGYKWEYDTQ